MTNERSTLFNIHEQYYTALFEAMPGNSVLVKNDAPKFTILAATPAYLKQTGYTREAMIGKGVFEAFPVNNTDPNYNGGEELRLSYLSASINKQPHYLPVQRYDLKNEDGSFSEKYWKISNSPVISPDGEVAYIIHTSEDITAQIKTQKREEAHLELQQGFQKLEQSEQRFRALVTAAANVIYRMNADWSEMRELQGKGFLSDTGEPIADWLEKYIYPTDQPRVKSAIEKAIDTRSNFELEHRVMQQDGTLGWTFSRAVPIVDNHGNIVEWFGAATDITHRKLAEEALRQSETRYRTLFDSVDQGFCVLEMIFDENNKPVDYKFLEVNPVFEKQTGLIAAIGKTAKELVPGLEQSWFDLYGKVATTGDAIRFTEGSAAMGKWFDVYAFRIGDNTSRKVALLFTNITERKKTEIALTEKDKNLRNIIHSAPVAMLILRGENMVVDTINERMIEMIGKTTSLINKPLLESIPELEGQRGYESFLTVYKTGKPEYGNEILIPLMRDGVLENRYFNFAYTPVIENGIITGVMDVATEVTEQVTARQKIEAAQQETEKQKRLYETVTGNTPDLIYVFDLSYRFTYANEALLTMWGKTADQAIGKGLLENGYEPWHAELHEREIDQITATKKPVRGEVSFPHSVLGKRVYDYILVPVLNKDGEVEAVAGTTRDITELKRAEESLKESERNLRTLIMQAPVAMCILIGPEHVVDIANDLMITLWGKRKEAVMNKPIFEGLPDAKEQGLENILAHVYATGETFKATEHPVELLRNGSLDIVYQNFVYEPYRDASGNILGVIAITTDVTDQVMARRKIEVIVAQRTKELAEVNDSLQHINKELQRSNQNLEEFAHAASHDLKEPIRKILFFTHLLKGQLTDRLKEAEVWSFVRIESATQRMGNLIDDLLLYSHVSHRPHETEPVDLNEKVKWVLEDLELDIQEKKAVIHIGVLPVVNGYRRQLQQLFQNLISNALKYSKATVAPRIDISASKASENGSSFHVIEVKDNGIGFEPEYGEKIFQMFTRLHNKDEYSGTGVGLSIVKKVIENHNGFIKVESSPEQGATFKVYLPV